MTTKMTDNKTAFTDVKETVFHSSKTHKFDVTTVCLHRNTNAVYLVTTTKRLKKLISNTVTVLKYYPSRKS